MDGMSVAAYLSKFRERAIAEMMEMNQMDRATAEVVVDKLIADTEDRMLNGCPKEGK